MAPTSRTLLLLSALCLPSSAWAQSAGSASGPAPSSAVAPTTTAVASPTSAATNPGDTGEVRRDPQGVQGISPFWEAMNQADGLFAAQDFVGAGAKYQSAIALAPQNPLGHLRMAELMIKQNELARAQEFVTAALRLSNDSMRYKAQASFLLAELRERQRASDDALDSWAAYKALHAQLLQAQTQKAPTSAPALPPTAPQGPLPPQIYVQTASLRIQAITHAKQLTVDYSVVKERIAQRLAEAEESAAKGK